MRGLPLTTTASPKGKRMLPFTRIFVLITAFVGVVILLEQRALDRSYRANPSNGLPFNDAAPLRGEDAAPLKFQQNDSGRACRVGRMNAVLVKSPRYATPATHPRPAIGSLDVYKDADSCTTYGDRYGAYDDEALGSTYLRTYRGPSSDPSMVFGKESPYAQQLMKANDLAEGSSTSYIDWGETVARCHADQPAARRALVLRSYENYTWGHDDIRNVRALIAELALNPSPNDRYDVHILVDVHRRNVSFSMSDEQKRRLLRTSVPREFWSIATLWSEEQMAWLYPGLPGKFLNHMPAVSSYRSCFMPLQVFARDHVDKYDYVWNWEMDTRTTQDYAQTIKDLERYARGAPIDPLLQQQSEWRIPARHDSAEERVGTQEADLITLNPIFNTTDSGWYWEYDFQNLPSNTERRASMGRNVRFSRRLLQAMNEANVDAKQSTHCESWPATVLVQQHQLQAPQSFEARWKGVYVPHPVYTRHDWPVGRLAPLINRHDVYRKVHEKTLRDVSFYYDGAHAYDIYDAWRTGSRVCRTPALLHPVKHQP